MLFRYKKLRPLKKALFALLIGIAMVSFWRGAWGLMDIYIFPGHDELSFWSSIFIGLGILAFTNYWTRELS